MLLFPNDKKASLSLNERSFYVLSPRHKTNESLCQLLRMAGFNQVKSITKELTASEKLKISDQDYGIIIDIEKQGNIEDTIPKILSLVPRNMWCCVVGDSDSITLAHAYAEQGIPYFYLPTQKEALITSAIAATQEKPKRWAVSISILGCKGGVGNSSIAHNLIKNIVKEREMPSLFVQGCLGSHDLDLLFGKKLVQEIVQGEKNLDLMYSASPLYPDLTRDEFRKYNFVIFEEAINTADKETLRQLAEQSSCLVLVTDRSAASIRVARDMIEITQTLDRLQRTPRRIFVCLSDTRPFIMNMLSADDIHSLLGRPLDIIFPYGKTQEKSSLIKRITGKSGPNNQLTKLILGGEDHHKNRHTLKRIRRA